MKIIRLSDTSFILFLYTKWNLHFEDIRHLQEELRTLFLRLKYQYGMKIEGFYEIKAYLDSKYGVVLEVKEENLEYLEEMDGEIEMRIEVLQQDFLYRLIDVLATPLSILEKGDLYSYEKEYYLHLTKEMTSYEMGKLLEYTECIYHPQNPFLISPQHKIDTQTNV